MQQGREGQRVRSHGGTPESAQALPETCGWWAVFQEGRLRWHQCGSSRPLCEGLTFNRILTHDPVSNEWPLLPAPSELPK